MQTATDIRSRIQADPDLRRLRDHIEWATAKDDRSRDRQGGRPSRGPARPPAAGGRPQPRTPAARPVRGPAAATPARHRRRGQAAAEGQRPRIALPRACRGRPEERDAGRRPGQAQAGAGGTEAVGARRGADPQAFPESMHKAAPAARGGRRPKRAVVGRAAQPRGATARRVVLRLDSIRCDEKTRELLEGRDEIAIQAIGFDEAGLAAGRAVFDNFIELGKFKDGEEKAQNGLELGSFDFDPADGLPQGFRAVIFLGELDRALFKKPKNDGFAMILLGLLVIGALLAIFVLTDGYIGAPLIMALTGGMVPFYAQLLSIVSDDAFEPENVAVFVEDPAQQFEPEVVRFRFGEGLLGLVQKPGAYSATVRFEIA
ncbi:MAG: hypothetical protein R3F55_22590 [Alphaproteobacteria bacterium]